MCLNIHAIISAEMYNLNFSEAPFKKSLRLSNYHYGCRLSAIDVTMCTQRFIEWFLQRGISQ